MIKIPGIKTHGRVGHYERNGIYSVDEVLPHVGQGIIDFDGDPIRMDSLRYALFSSNLTCVRCNVVGLFFAKERSIYLDRNRKTERYWVTNPHYHFNLYGINQYGHEVMLTKDHKMPRAHGGADDLDNLQTMCSPCNGRKRDRRPDETEEQYGERRRRQKKAERLRNVLQTRGGIDPTLIDAELSPR